MREVGFRKVDEVRGALFVAEVGLDAQDFDVVGWFEVLGEVGCDFGGFVGGVVEDEGGAFGGEITGDGGADAWAIVMSGVDPFGS